MVNIALSLGGLIGILLSGAFLYVEVGRYATPQVPVSLFDERKELVSYAAGLFAGIPLTIPWLFLLSALSNVAYVSAAVDLALLILGSELAQWFLLRSTYFGRDAAGTFYALGMRAGIAGILILAFGTEYFAAGSFSAFGLFLLVLTSGALVIIEVAAGLLSMSASPLRPGVRGSPVSGGVLSAVGIVLIGFGWTSQGYLGLAAILLGIAGGSWTYFRLRDPILSRVRAATAAPTETVPSRYGRLASSDPAEPDLALPDAKDPEPPLGK
jgi:hypothetical protein